ncbi:PIG-P-domain-containing protein [Choanephora cucurbitarum]|nr:PIG-P-domain-containing protein [Choanephora cucurbitarum]
MPINEVKNKPSLQPYLSHQLTAERLLSKNALTFQTSRSTSSLPSLVSYNNSSNHLKPTQMNAMRRGYSQEPTRSFKKPTEQPKKTLTTKRRHSFSNFLAIKFAKKPITDDSKQTSALTATNIITFSNSTLAGNKPLSTTQQAKKGHRPRSYSELPYNLPQVERAPPVAITNKTPAYEYYGFVMYLSSFVVFGIYILWAYLPDGVLDQLGITYYPSRYWALAIPIWLMTFVWFIFLSFMAINLMNTPSFDSIYCITGN